MLSLSVHILIVSGTILLAAVGLAYVNSVAPPHSRSTQKELEKDEYLRNAQYVRDISTLKSVRNSKLNKKLRHQK